MYWIYILKCENNYFYVGETKRLYRRFWEHFQGKGGVNTFINKPIDIIAVYKVNTIGKFFEYNSSEYNKWLLIKFNEDNKDYDSKEIENNITECLMIANKEKTIRGGKYTRCDIQYKLPKKSELPICHCGLPCDVKKNDEKNYLYFRCAKKNIWDSFKDQFDIEEDPCKFYQEYTKDKIYREQELKQFEEKKKIRKELLKKLYKKSDWLINVPSNEPTCICCDKTEYDKIAYNLDERCLCFDCFINYNEDLAEEYTKESKCLIKINK